MPLDAILFYVFGALAVGASLLVIGQRNPVYSVMLLIASFGGLAGLYVLLESPFTAVIQLIVYAGAIMVLFLFVVMLLNVPREDAAEYDRAHPLDQPGARRFGALLAILFLIQFAWAAWHLGTRQPGSFADVPPGDMSSVGRVGQVLYSEYAVPFEVTSILILVAMIGAIVIARRGSP